jgi:2-polyprenyl-3-methyl-5-hydroxy-6-metoxy-1,4-benzoquinol methylase
MSEWFENESQWKGTYVSAFNPQKFIDAVEEVEKLLKLTQFYKKNILDLCCGPGRHSVRLAQKGFQVVGVDLSAFLLQKADTLAKDEGVQVEYVREDMRKFLRKESFDLIICLYNSFGYFENRDDDLKVLRNVYQNLKPGGRFLLEATSKEVLARNYSNLLTFEVGNITAVIKRKITQNWNRTENILHIIEGNEIRRYPYSLNLYSGQEIIDKMKNAHFRNITLYGDLDGNPYGPDAKNLFAIGYKEIT